MVAAFFALNHIAKKSGCLTPAEFAHYFTLENIELFGTYRETPISYIMVFNNDGNQTLTFIRTTKILGQDLTYCLITVVDKEGDDAKF